MADLLLQSRNGRYHLVSIDDCDVELCAAYNWYVMRDGYARSTVLDQGRRISMHRHIVGAPDHLEVDHIDGDRLNNRRGNLRLATRAENARNRGRPSNNTSGFPGVSWHKQACKWQAIVQVHGRGRYLGLFTDVREAAKAAAHARAELFGEFSRVLGPRLIEDEGGA